MQTGVYKLIPKYGAYAAVVRLQDGSAHRAVVNIGLQPSIGDLPLAVEAHILDFNADIYGQTIDVDLLTFIRAEQKFETPNRHGCGLCPQLLNFWTHPKITDGIEHGENHHADVCKNSRPHIGNAERAEQKTERFD